MTKFILLLALLSLNFPKADFYVTMQTDDGDKMEQLYTHIADHMTGLDSMAYLGALKMRHAGVINRPVRKLNVFRDGHKLLEAAIAEEPDRIEYRFLRLMIQENAPDILGYNDNIKQDAALIKQHFRFMDEVLKDAIRDYVEQSEVLEL